MVCAKHGVASDSSAANHVQLHVIRSLLMCCKPYPIYLAAWCAKHGIASVSSAANAAACDQTIVDVVL